MAIPGDMYVQLSYAAPGIRDVAARLDRIARSAAPPDREAVPADPGFIRRSIGVATIEVPEELNPPSVYSFEFPANGVTMQMNVWRPGDPVAPKSLLEQISADTASATLVAPPTPESIQTRGGGGQIVSYTLVTKLIDGVEETAVWRARILLRSGAVASVSAQADAPDKSAVDAAFLAFIQSVSAN